ncbi:MAG: ABC transporter ATP-binding protein [Nitrospirota bacterium]|nr:ABC transporter ATP-binding protein [Nitrospirota bacterium]
MIQVENLTKNFGPYQALKGVSFHVNKGEILGFLGPNGAGKTTTMRILTGFFPATSGSASIAGFDVFDEPFEVKKRIGYLPENVPLYRDMEVEDYLRFVAGIKGVPVGDVKQKVARAMEDVAVTHMKRKLIGELSKGYRQRVGLAQAIINDPEVLILDEPTVGLDPKQIIEIRKLIKEMAGNRTVILSTHILHEVSLICQRVVIINEGRVIAEDTPENLTGKVRKSPHLIVRVGDEAPVDKVKAELSRINGVRKVEVKEDGAFQVEMEAGKDLRKDISAAVVGKGWELLEVRQLDLSLEDIFIKLVNREDRKEKAEV